MFKSLESVMDVVSQRPTLKRGSGETVQKVWRCRNVGSSNQIAPFQIDYVMRTFQKISGLRLITSGDSAA